MLIFYSMFLNVESKVVPVVERDRLLSSGEQEMIMWKVDLRTRLFQGYTQRMWEF
jgi:hypothetical protein